MSAATFAPLKELFLRLHVCVAGQCGESPAPLIRSTQSSWQVRSVSSERRPHSDRRSERSAERESEASAPGVDGALRCSAHCFPPTPKLPHTGKKKISRDVTETIICFQTEAETMRFQLGRLLGRSQHIVWRARGFQKKDWHLASRSSDVEQHRNRTETPTVYF